MARLDGRKIAFLCAPEGTEQVELTDPRDHLGGEGAQTHLISTESGEIQAFNHLTKADTFEVDRTVSECSAQDYDMLVLPGGVANPDNLRMQDEAVQFIRDFAEAGKPVAAICHAPWTLIEADVVNGRKMTSFWSLQTDLRNAGADWVDEEVVVCQGGRSTFITSRYPDDLKVFDDAIVDVLDRETSQA
jgi:protease I